MPGNKITTKRFNVKEMFTKAKNKDFYNLFQPVIPKIDLTGKIAQVISALTEAVTVWFICQSEMEGANKLLAILASIFAVIIVVAAIEIGGRKALQVFLRVIVWKKLVSGWHWVLFIFVGLITVFLFSQSYTLSTKGIKKSISSNVKKTVIFDDSHLQVRHDTLTSQINRRFDRQRLTLLNNFNLNYNSKKAELEAAILRKDAKIDQRKKEKELGFKWASSHIRKETRLKDDLIAQKPKQLALISTAHTADLKVLESKRQAALEQESKRHQKAVEKAENANDENDTNDKDNAAFWSNLFSNLVGVMIATAFTCIVMVEVFRRGAGITIEYVENELPPSLIGLVLKGIKNRVYNVCYGIVELIYADKKDFDFAFLKTDDEDNDPSTPPGRGKQSNQGKQQKVNTKYQVKDEYVNTNFSENKANKKPKMTVLKGTSTSTPPPKTDGGVAKKPKVNSKQSLKNPVGNRAGAGKQSGKQSKEQVNNTGKQSLAGKQSKVNSAGKQSKVNSANKKDKLFTTNEMEVVEVNTEIFVKIGEKLWPKAKVLSNLKTNKGYLTKIENGIDIQRKPETVKKNVAKWRDASLLILQYESNMPKKNVTLTVTNSDAKVA